MSKKKHIPPPKKSNLTLVYAGLAVLIIAALAVYLLSNPGPSRLPEKLPTAGEYVKLDLPSTYEPGKVKIMEFLKFDCSHCYDLHKNLPQLLDKYGNNVSITYTPIVWQGQSTKSIEAYIIAKQMGKGDQMQDALFNALWVNKTDVMESTIVLENVAASIGLGPEFNTELEGNKARTLALANLQNMTKYGVQGTPTIVINGNLQVTPTLTNLDAVIGSLLG